MWHGNQLLATTVRGYQRDAQKPPHHTVDAVLDYLANPGITRPSGMVPLNGVTSAADAFLGYLMLDALIGNTDRHHENWGLMQVSWQDEVAGAQAYMAGGNVAAAFYRESVELAPSYDHASSMGRDLVDQARSTRLSGHDPRVTVEHYCARGRSPLFGSRFDATRKIWEESTQLTFREAFERGCELSPEVGAVWLRHLATMDESDLQRVVDRVPAEFASDVARAFAKAVLASNRKFLLSLPRCPS